MNWQTGSSCADCRIGAYGPALTPYGMREPCADLSGLAPARRDNVPATYL